MYHQCIIVGDDVDGSCTQDLGLNLVEVVVVLKT